MEKSADFIRKKEFHIVFKGYKPEEVDKFLDILSVEFDRLLKRNRELQDSLDKLKFENTEEDTDIKKVIQDALISAHKVAEEIKLQAKKEADLLMDQRKSQEDRYIHDLQMKKIQIEEAMIILQGRYDDFKNKIKKTISDMSQFVEEVNTGIVPSDYTESDFSDAKFTADADLEPSMEEVSAKSMAFEEPQEEEAAVTSGEEESPLQETDRINSPSEDARNSSVFDNYNISNERDSGYYFERMQNRDKEAEATDGKDPVLEPYGGQKSETQEAEENAGTLNTEDDSILKRERKKIDIANPDIIENFFRASDD